MHFKLYRRSITSTNHQHNSSISIKTLLSNLHRIVSPQKQGLMFAETRWRGFQRWSYAAYIHHSMRERRRYSISLSLGLYNYGKKETDDLRHKRQVDSDCIAHGCLPQKPIAVVLTCLFLHNSLLPASQRHLRGSTPVAYVVTKTM